MLVVDARTTSRARDQHRCRTDCRRSQFAAESQPRRPIFRLVVGAAIAPVRKIIGELDREKITAHVGAMVDEAIDAIAVSTAHGHSAGVGDMVKLLRSAFPTLTIIAGNVTSAAGAEYLAECGANAIKIGQGPGSICTTRMVAGVGIPQLTALWAAGKGARARGARIIADGGITNPATSSRRSPWRTPSLRRAVRAAVARRRARSSRSTARLYKQYAAGGTLPP